MDALNVQLSVALVTRNRPESLERALTSLRLQSLQPWEVLVSDDSDDAHAAATRTVAEAHGCRYLRGPGRGLYANRNHSALACRGTHIRTMDDDHEFPAGHIEECLRAVRAAPEAVWVIGEYPVMAADVAPHFKSLQSCIIVGEYTPSSVPDVPVLCPGQLTATGLAGAPTDPQRCWSISDGATIYPMGIFKRGLRYMDRYLFGASYLEFGSRLYWLGYRMRHLSSTYVVHHYHPQTRSFVSTEMDVSSRIFAMLCHAFLYQPSVKNRATCLLALVKLLLKHRALGAKLILTGLRDYGHHRRETSDGQRGQHEHGERPLPQALVDVEHSMALRDGRQNAHSTSPCAEA